MSLKIKTLVAKDSGLTAEYRLTHSTPGAHGTTIEAPLKIVANTMCAQAELHISECEGSTPDEALDRMVIWLRRLADGLEKREKSIAIPT